MVEAGDGRLRLTPSPGRSWSQAQNMYSHSFQQPTFKDVKEAVIDDLSKLCTNQIHKWSHFFRNVRARFSPAPLFRTLFHFLLIFFGPLFRFLFRIPPCREASRLRAGRPHVFPHLETRPTRHAPVQIIHRFSHQLIRQCLHAFRA